MAGISTKVIAFSYRRVSSSPLPNQPKENMSKWIRSILYHFSEYQRVLPQLHFQLPYNPPDYPSIIQTAADVSSMARTARLEGDVIRGGAVYSPSEELPGFLKAVLLPNNACGRDQKPGHREHQSSILSGFRVHTLSAPANDFADSFFPRSSSTSAEDTATWKPKSA